MTTALVTVQLHPNNIEIIIRQPLSVNNWQSLNSDSVHPHITRQLSKPPNTSPQHQGGPVARRRACKIQNSRGTHSRKPTAARPGAPAQLQPRTSDNPRGTPFPAATAPQTGDRGLLQRCMPARPMGTRCPWPTAALTAGALRRCPAYGQVPVQAKQLPCPLQHWDVTVMCRIEQHLLIPGAAVLPGPRQLPQVAAARRLHACSRIPRAAAPPGPLQRRQAPVATRELADQRTPSEAVRPCPPQRFELAAGSGSNYDVEGAAGAPGKLQGGHAAIVRRPGRDVLPLFNPQAVPLLLHLPEWERKKLQAGQDHSITIRQPFRLCLDLRLLACCPLAPLLADQADCEAPIADGQVLED